MSFNITLLFTILQSFKGLFLRINKKKEGKQINGLLAVVDFDSFFLEKL